MDWEKIFKISCIIFICLFAINMMLPISPSILLDIFHVILGNFAEILVIALGYILFQDNRVIKYIVLPSLASIWIYRLIYESLYYIPKLSKTYFVLGGVYGYVGVMMLGGLIAIMTLITNKKNKNG